MVGRAGIALVRGSESVSVLESDCIPNGLALPRPLVARSMPANLLHFECSVELRPLLRGLQPARGIHTGHVVGGLDD